MNCAPLQICQRWLAVDGVPENIEHSREDLFADRRFQRPPGVFHGCAAGEALGGGSAQFHVHNARRVELIPR